MLRVQQKPVSVYYMVIFGILVVGAEGRVLEEQRIHTAWSG